jgi:hypothetical protein
LESFREANPDIKIVGISRAKRGDTGLLLQLLDLDAYIHEPLTPEALIISLPEIADRYSMQSVENTSRQSPDDRHRQKWRLNPFVTNRRSPSPQV